MVSGMPTLPNASYIGLLSAAACTPGESVVSVVEDVAEADGFTGGAWSTSWPTACALAAVNPKPQSSSFELCRYMAYCCCSPRSSTATTRGPC